VQPATKPRLKENTYRVRVLVIPLTLEMLLYGAAPRYEWRTITGFTLKDAKRKAGIQ
jgi:hypothetical protein